MTAARTLSSPRTPFWLIRANTTRRDAISSTLNLLLPWNKPISPGPMFTAMSISPDCKLNARVLGSSIEGISTVLNGTLPSQYLSFATISARSFVKDLTTYGPVPIGPSLAKLRPSFSDCTSTMRNNGSAKRPGILGYSFVV